ncbi:EamA domain-containing membrane protein RarD [Pasteurella langaaensis DSM 22999]|uniref:EamA domain-containing membrane protein RarD n=1 Tax=Alitibacter langaaensis DSM 22999 TaxID=1122935 RepID=A0A2U0T8P2_9PAST|nr:DMT family transporter [Pasteurella langaaensis]PVX39917.1 EamA domain-containing membrane protein RarD [Pasteurella langaaensis DSM 22999]
MKQQQPVLGFLFGLIAACMWSSLPLFVQQVVKVMDIQTSVWYRFALSMLCVFLLICFSGKLSGLKRISLKNLFLILVATAGLSVNFYLYNLALKYIPPTTTQVLSPLSSFMMLFAGVLIFKEKIALHQKIGLAVLSIGLILFFNERLDDFLQLNIYFKGVVITVASSFVWVIYAIMQKALLAHFSSQQILLMIYIGCTIVFFPNADIHQVSQLDHFQLICLLFSGVNTVIAYGCYAEALNRWEVSKVSAILTQIPIFTLVFAHIATMIAPNYFVAVELNWISYCGAVLVVSGAMLSALGHKLKMLKEQA